VSLSLGPAGGIFATLPTRAIVFAFAAVVASSFACASTLPRRPDMRAPAAGAASSAGAASFFSSAAGAASASTAGACDASSSFSPSTSSTDAHASSLMSSCHTKVPSVIELAP
jgi:hypothetical protein